jgi:hypothetical protein
MLRILGILIPLAAHIAAHMSGIRRPPNIFTGTPVVKTHSLKI